MTLLSSCRRWGFAQCGTDRVKPPDTVFGVPLVAAVCPNPTLPIPGFATGVTEINVLPTAHDDTVTRSWTTRQRLVTHGDGHRIWESSSPYRARCVLGGLPATCFGVGRS
ncbi:hypothetical protein GCM10009835_34410 [Planosporangium flavigriseum]|uniref:Uncharacterized protein n=1 Tax=Planosporangium flavigriseum TaxID=373681 RepID=A0A8J3PMF8_9ACTN|nr:hypothetical protein Pfl04_12850 [Planosporangium flavigriseum]